MRYGIVIDTKRCFGCNACTIACKQKNGTPSGVFWNRVYVNEVGSYPTVRREYTPALCMHCDIPACVAVCPTGASYKREDGIVLVDQNKCVGCRYCMVACPYNARYFDNGSSEGYFPGKGLVAYETAQQLGKIKGTVSKCTMCADRIAVGEEPACVQTCPTKVRVFGDLDDPNSEISKLIVARGGYQIHPELGTNPSVYYLRG
ncbi:MAG: sulfate reduction electron transfer complex DsrMKJOP subunit DsrO [Anaerolineales bacterium]|jgi:molybdopterin-containing oxidoreductase family iron-sulfur binding subunit